MQATIPHYTFAHAEVLARCASLDLVVVFTGGAFNVRSPVNTLMARVLLPALLNAGPATPGPAGRD
jgi:hypothetical protein